MLSLKRQGLISNLVHMAMINYLALLPFINHEKLNRQDLCNLTSMQGCKWGLTNENKSVKCKLLLLLSEADNNLSVTMQLPGFSFISILKYLDYR